MSKLVWWRTETPSISIPSIQKEFKKVINQVTPINFKNRFDFYDEVFSLDTNLIIVTGEIRRYGNILLQIGCIFDFPQVNNDKI